MTYSVFPSTIKTLKEQEEEVIKNIDLNAKEFLGLTKLIKERVPIKAIEDYFNNTEEFNSLTYHQRVYLIGLAKSSVYNDEEVGRESLLADQIESIRAVDLINSDIEPIKWLVDGILPEKSITILGGDVGNLKTYTALYIALCCSKGHACFGNFVTEKIRVLYIDEENRKETIYSRLHALYSGLDLDKNEDIDLEFMICYDIKLSTSRSSNLHILERKLKAFRPHLVIVDSLVRVMEGNENDVQEVRKVFDILKNFIINYESSWLLLHHTRKGNGTRTKYKDDLRGSSDFGAFVDIIMMINKLDDETYLLNQPKNRLAIPTQSFKIKFDGFNLKFDEFVNSKDFSARLTAGEKCSEVITKWIRDNNIKDFETKEVTSKFGGEYRNNARSDALNILFGKGAISNVSRGKWEVKDV
jgi:hypothetical protein